MVDKLSMKELYCRLRKLKREIKKTDPIYIRQKDFDEGTYIINEPGYYVFAEDIIFSPNSNNDYLPKKDKYATLGYSLGFFTAISIYGEDVYLNLNGFTLKASPEFTLQQRFFSLIELADAPFITSEGPGTFTTGIKSAKNVIVGNGNLGLSSHHGIHGNLAENVLIEDLCIYDFEFVGIALNGGNNIIVKDVDIGPNRTDIPVLATYSAGRFVKMFTNKLLEYPIEDSYKSQLESKLYELNTEMDKTFDEIMNGESVSSDLFRNDSMLPDGNIYGCLIKNKGFAVNDFVDSKQVKVEKKDKTKNVFIHNVKFHDLKCRVDEVIALSGLKGVGVQNDVAGAVLQIDKIKNNDGIYVGTVLSDLQLLLAEVSNSLNISLGKNTISMDTVDWAKNKTNISDLLGKGYKYKCSGDSMHHVNKGNVCRFDALDNLRIKKCKIYNVKNYGRLGNGKIDGNYLKSHDAAKRDGYFGADAYGINISYCSDTKISKCKIEKIIAKHGDAIGMNIIFDSKVEIEKCKIFNIKAGTLIRDRCGHEKWRGLNYYEKWVKYTNDKPNKIPRSIGIKIDKSSEANICDVCIKDLHSCAKPIKIYRE